MATDKSTLANLHEQCRLPLIAAPMFLVSGPQLVIETCKAGVIGTFPALNQRTAEGFEQWLQEIESALASYSGGASAGAAPFGVNLIVHDSNPRLQEDLDLIVKHEVPLVITSLGAVPDVVDAVHQYGGVVYHDVINIRHAKKAAAAGVDGLIAVCAGAGGHAGLLSPFALIGEIRQFFSGALILSGCLSSGGDLASAIAMGADFGYMGTRFICSRESAAPSAYKEMIERATAVDIVYTDRISGVNANFLKASIERSGLSLDSMPDHRKPDFGKELLAPEDGAKAWKDIWSAGQGVGNIQQTLSVAELIDKIAEEYQVASNAVTVWGESKAPGTAR